MKKNVIHSIELGGIPFASNLIQAPLAGVSVAPFRELIHHYGGAAYCVTEMVSAKTLLHKPPRRYVYKSPAEGLLCFQLSGNDPVELQKAAIQAEQHGADLIDLNCGCPVEKIRKKGCGSKLLSMSKTLETIIQSIKAEVNLPLSLKIRVDGQSDDQFNTDVVKAINDAGADFLIVHGRHWTEDYETPVRLDEIANIVANANIPVIGNGDVKDYESLQNMLETGCKGAMIGRGSVGKPWLFQELLAIDQGQSFVAPSSAEIGNLLLKHVRGLILLEKETPALLQARKLAKYYLRAAGCEAAYPKFKMIRHYAELEQLVRQVLNNSIL